MSDPRKLSRLQHFIGGRAVSLTALVTAGVTVVLTDAQGLAAVLVLMTASGTALRSGRRAGVLVTAAAGGIFVAVMVVLDKATGVGLALAVIAVALWMVTAWSAGLTVDELRRINEQLAATVREVDHRSLHDSLTGLANRTLLLDRLAQAVARGARHQTRLAVLFVDLDNFKLINDSLGHQVGDALLVKIAHRLREQLRSTDTAARFGGDEFVLICDDLRDDQESVRIAERLTSALHLPFVVNDRQITLTASIGIAIPSSPVQSPQELLQAADQAMYQAKANGGDGFDLFNDVLRERAVHRLNTEIELRRAIANSDLHLVYQPIIDLTDNRISGVEALVRWSHPTRGLLAPAEFLPIAEDSSLIVPIRTWVLNAACAQARRWNSAAAGRPLTMAVNVSLRQLSSGSFELALDQALSRSGADPHQIHLEITETVLMGATRSMRTQLSSVSDHGIHVGLDDFGTGHSSLSLLKEFPVKFLKIDRSFISGLGQDRDDTAITGAVIALSQTLGMDVVAEGIESPDQLEILRHLGCRYAQGYYLSRPQSADELQDVLDRHPTWHPVLR